MAHRPDVANAGNGNKAAMPWGYKPKDYGQTHPERVAAVAAIHEYLNSIVRQSLSSTDPQAMATALWGLVHGLAVLHLEGKFDTSSADAVAEKVRTSVRAMLAASGCGQRRSGALDRG